MIVPCEIFKYDWLCAILEEAPKQKKPLISVTLPGRNKDKQLKKDNDDLKLRLDDIAKENENLANDKKDLNNVIAELTKEIEDLKKIPEPVPIVVIKAPKLERKVLAYVC